MSQETKHTPLPYQIGFSDGSGSGKDGGAISITPCNGEELETVIFGDNYDGVMMGVTGLDPQQALANAEFIVTACNSYYWLLNTLKNVLELNKDYLEKHQPGQLSDIQAAIAKATEGE